MTATAASNAGEDPDHLSSLLNSLVDGHAQDERITVGEILEALRGRALAVMIFLFAAPTALPMPPGFSTITAVPLIFLTAQLMLGLKPWLPAFVTKRSVRRSDLRRVLKAAEPWIARAERAMRPRFPWLVRERVVGLVAFILAVVLVLPIPGGNFPPSVALCLLSLGVLGTDSGLPSASAPRSRPPCWPSRSSGRSLQVAATSWARCSASRGLRPKIASCPETPSSCRPSPVSGRSAAW